MPQITLEMLERWLDCLEGYWNQLNREYGCSAKGGLEGAIERGEEPEIAEMRQVIAEMKSEVGS